MRALEMGDVGVLYINREDDPGYLVFRVSWVAGRGSFTYGALNPVDSGNVLRVSSNSLVVDNVKVAMVPSEHKDHLLHVEFRVRPLLEAGIEVPSGAKQFDYGPLLTAEDASPFGWRAEPIETIVLPDLSYYLVFRNQYGSTVTPMLSWEYAWYKWSPVRDAGLAFRALKDPRTPRWLLYGTRMIRYDVKRLLGVDRLIPLDADYDEVSRIVSGW